MMSSNRNEPPMFQMSFGSRVLDPETERDSGFRFESEVPNSRVGSRSSRRMKGVDDDGPEKTDFLGMSAELFRS